MTADASSPADSPSSPASENPHPGTAGADPRNPARVKSTPTRQAGLDERGTASWEWAVTTRSLNSEELSKRLRKLDSHLCLAEEANAARSKRAQENVEGVLQGYSPYDSGHLIKKSASSKKKDLRRLSEWLKLRSRMNKTKDADDGEQS